MMEITKLNRINCYMATCRPLHGPFLEGLHVYCWPGQTTLTLLANDAVKVKRYFASAASHAV